MPRKTIAQKIIIPASTTTKTAIYTVPDAKTFKLKQLCVHFPSGASSNVLVAAYHGLRKIAPEEGYLSGDNSTACSDADEEYTAATEIVIEAVNNQASSITIDVTVDGDEEP